MSDYEIIESNKLIAKFMDVISPRQSESWDYHWSWSCLMPVVEKIEKLGYGWTVDPWGIEVIDYTTGNEEVRAEFVDDDSCPKIEQYFNTVIQFITWFNQESNNNKS